MMLRRTLAVAVILGLAGCGGEPPRSESGSQEQDPATGGSEDSEPRIVTGYLTVEEAPVITVCESNEERIVDGPAFADLLDLHGALAPGVQPMEGVFVDVLGSFGEGTRGPAIEVLEVRRAAWEGGGCADPEPDLSFRAQGTEPFWSLTVSGESMTWRSPEGEESLVHRGPYRSDRGDWLVDGREPDAAAGVGGAAAGEPVLTARFYPTPCQDAMSGAWFHMSAEVSFRGRELQGCAYTGEAFSP